MTEETENLILGILKKIQAEQAEIRRDIREIKDRLTLMDGAIAAIRSEMANLYGLYAHQSSRIDRIEDRLERIERRLELRDETP